MREQFEESISFLRTENDLLHQQLSEIVRRYELKEEELETLKKNMQTFYDSGLTEKLQKQIADKTAQV